MGDERCLSYLWAAPDDAPFLAMMNRQLIDDEGHCNPMTVEELAARMGTWLSDDYAALLVLRDDEPVGYALWRDETDWIYLRQFFIAREHRGQGIGRQFMRELTSAVWSPGKCIRVEVLVGNAAGLAFWRAIGFADYAMTLEMERT
jgi:GNAT superfamily N-acetyltransferase